MAIPPGVSQEDFNTALQQFENVVGKDWVFTSDADVALYKDAYTPLWGEPDEIVASAAVAPDNAEEVQKVVEIANKYKVPIYPISTGKNLGYGGSAPVLSGSVVLDLKRMNRILEVNDQNHYVLVEPGVSYFDLYRHIEDNGYDLMMDCPDPGWGSLIGNALDHGCGYTTTPFRDHFDAHCGMEVVLANGEILRTGMGALPGAKTWQEYPYGFGPSLDGIFSQSNFGVITKMGFWLQPKPEAFRKVTINVYNREDIIPLVSIQTYLENSGLCMGLPDFGTPLLSGVRRGSPLSGVRRDDAAGVSAELMNLLGTKGGPPMDELGNFGKQNDIPYWTLDLKYYGPPRVIDAQWAHARENFSKIDGVRFEEDKLYNLPLSENDKDEIHKVSLGIPNLSIFFIGARTASNSDPDDGHIWFSPMIPRTGEAILEAQEFYGTVLRENGINLPGYNVMPASYFRRAFLLLFGFPIRQNVEENQKTREAFRKIVTLSAERGWAEYRTAPAFMDDVMDVYSYNDNILRRFNETLKDAVDPNGIISAGRSGIWPKHLRKA
jgi:4-cresol dehydrogenase (hydroxylating)